VATEIALATIRFCRPLAVGLDPADERAIAHRQLNSYFDGLTASQHLARFDRFVLRAGASLRSVSGRRHRVKGVAVPLRCTPGLRPPRDWPQHSLWHRFYSMLIFWSLSRLAVMDSDTEVVPLIHAPPSLKRSSGKGPKSKTSVTTVALSPSGSRM
jgi:hypothetical protein